MTRITKDGICCCKRALSSSITALFYNFLCIAAFTIICVKISSWTGKVVCPTVVGMPDFNHSAMTTMQSEFLVLTNWCCCRSIPAAASPNFNQQKYQCILYNIFVKKLNSLINSRITSIHTGRSVWSFQFVVKTYCLIRKSFSEHGFTWA